MTPSTSTTERQAPEKATLFCPECGHESHINGDWILQVHAHSVAYQCPNCDTVIESRRVREELTAVNSRSLHLVAEN